MRGLPKFSDPNLLVGTEHFSDAGVYRLRDDLAIVQSVDFFPPIVDDPFIFGQIAAANSLSDLYALGAKPVTAMNIVCFPDTDLPVETLGEILRGGAERVAAAGAVVVGGHSVRDAELKFGLAATGVIDPKRMLGNDGARPGDALVLTKALGTSFIATANKAGRCPEATLAAACESMTALNDISGEEAMLRDAHAATDITGFALAGHAIELARASGVTVEVELGALPLLPGALDLASPENFARANAGNRAHAGDAVRLPERADERLVEFLFDPQTSGGLLVSLPQNRVEAYIGALRERGVAAAAIVGRIAEPSSHALVVHP